MPQRVSAGARAAKGAVPPAPDPEASQDCCPMAGVPLRDPFGTLDDESCSYSAAPVGGMARSDS